MLYRVIGAKAKHLVHSNPYKSRAPIADHSSRQNASVALTWTTTLDSVISLSLSRHRIRQAHVPWIWISVDRIWILIAFSDHAWMHAFSVSTFAWSIGASVVHGIYGSVCFACLSVLIFYGRFGAGNMYYYYYYLPHSNWAVSHTISILLESRHLDVQFILINGTSACTNQIGFVRVVSVKASNLNCCVHAVNLRLLRIDFSQRHTIVLCVLCMFLSLKVRHDHICWIRFHIRWLLLRIAIRIMENQITGHSFECKTLPNGQRIGCTFLAVDSVRQIDC